mgnify:CR=1 FL=1|tara:strand:+ start:1363 stop:1764 length:402 start_codon:yes stop_codon:yes gene_type:complete
MSNNVNKAKNDGRTHNKKLPRVKIKRDVTTKESAKLPSAIVTPLKKSRAEKLSSKAIKNIFGSEDGIWDKIAENALNGDFNCLRMIMEYKYGKAGDNILKQDHRPATPKKAPQIVFNVESKDNTIDVNHVEDE